MATAEPERTVLTVIQDREDREIRVSLVRYPEFPEFGEFREVSYYIPSRELYTMGYAFPEQHSSKIAAAMRAKAPSE